MSYSKQTWQTGDVVTSAKLNHMEDGIAAAGGGGVLVVNVSVTEVDIDTVYTCDKTAGEMFAFLENGSLIFKINRGGDITYGTLVNSHYYPDDPDIKYDFMVNGDSEIVLVAATSADYPTSPT